MKKQCALCSESTEKNFTSVVAPSGEKVFLHPKCLSDFVDQGANGWRKCYGSMFTADYSTCDCSCGHADDSCPACRRIGNGWFHSRQHLRAMGIRCE